MKKIKQEEARNTTKGVASSNKNKKRTRSIKRKTNVGDSSVRMYRPKGSDLRVSSKKQVQPKQTIQKGEEKLKIMVLGGLEEVGRNMTLLEYGNDIIIIDMGLQFPEEDMPGIDYIIPNVSYLKGKEDRIKGVIITHGHYDHIGAVSHLIGKLGEPIIYTGRLTAGLLHKRHEDFRNVNKLKIQEIDSKTILQLGIFRVEFFRVNHSIPDCFGVVVHSPVGAVVHTGDFKFDNKPINEKPADLNKIAQIGAKGVLALMSDSTDAEHPGHQLSETQAGETLEKIFEQADGRIIIGTFASLLSRVQQLITIAEKSGRKVLAEGRSMKSNIEIAHKMGYLKVKPGTLLDENSFKRVPDNKLVIIGTGAQGEQNAVLMRIANNEHRYLSIKKNDTVVFSSSVIPGNERTIQSLKDTFYRHGAKVIHYKMMDVHAGGHAKQEDLKLMMRLIKPKYLIPIEANHYMLIIHGELGKEIGIPDKNVFIANNGQVMEFAKDIKTKEVVGRMTNNKVPTDYVMVDGLGVGDVSQIVLRDRKMMAEDGMFVVIVTVSRQTGQLVSSPDIISRGFVYMKESKKLIESSRSRVKKILKDNDPKSPAYADYIKDKIRNNIGQFLYSKTKRRPMVLPVVIEV